MDFSIAVKNTYKESVEGRIGLRLKRQSGNGAVRLLELGAGNLPPIAVQIAEEKRSVFASFLDLLERGNFPSVAIRLKRSVSFVNGAGRVHC
jgi:hypothetical protein